MSQEHGHLIFGASGKLQSASAAGADVGTLWQSAPPPSPEDGGRAVPKHSARYAAAFWIAGGFQVPSRIEGGVSLGQ